MEMKWKPPKDDGGAKVTEYVIEMREEGSSWNPVGESQGNSFNKEGLVKGNKYQFRVRAVNLGGESEPSKATKMKICKERNCELNKDYHYLICNVFSFISLFSFIVKKYEFIMDFYQVLTILKFFGSFVEIFIAFKTFFLMFCL